MFTNLFNITDIPFPVMLNYLFGHREWWLTALTQIYKAYKAEAENELKGSDVTSCCIMGHVGHVGSYSHVHTLLLSSSERDKSLKIGKITRKREENMSGRIVNLEKMILINDSHPYDDPCQRSLWINSANAFKHNIPCTFALLVTTIRFNAI